MKREKNNTKTINKILFTVFMAIIFILIAEFGIWGYGGRTLIKSIFYYPQGDQVVKELILAILSLIVMLLFKNFYVFTQKKEKLSRSLFYGLFFLMFATLYTIIGMIGVIESSSWYTLLNIFLWSLLVGICEEFLCRGWLLNEFLERFGDSKKGVWYSIIISGIIFGLMHLGNIESGQSVANTIIQVINATGIGIAFGSIYYKTRNIWSVIILHAYWDFSLFLSSYGSPITASTEIVTSITLLGVIFSLLMVASEIFSIVPIAKDFKEEPKNSKIVAYSIVSLCTYIFFMFAFAFISSNIGEEYRYDSIDINEFAIISDNYSKYNINYDREILVESYDPNNEYLSVIEKLSYTLYKENDDLVLVNNNNGEKINFECEDLLDYIVMEDNDNYVIAYLDYTDSTNTFINYIYLNKNELSNAFGYLEKVKENMKKCLLPDIEKLYILNDGINNASYVTAYSQDYGYYLLTNEDKILMLNK